MPVSASYLDDANEKQNAQGHRTFAVGEGEGGKSKRENIVPSGTDEPPSGVTGETVAKALPD